MDSPFRPSRGMGDRWPVTEWEFADAWFATAVASQQNPCDLADVIAAGDAIDHAIFTREEIQQAVSRLAGAGLLEVSDDGRFALTSAGADLLERRQGGLFEQVDSVLELLREEIPVEEVAWSVTEEAVRSAYVAYMHSGDLDTRGP
jgi:hypothetical protein